MAISVRVDPLLERELELAARRKGMTKSQFVIAAVEQALGRKNPYELMVKLQAEEAARTSPAVKKAFKGHEQPYETVGSRKALLDKLNAKHGVGRTG
jgi:hypothetical protein